MQKDFVASPEEKEKEKVTEISRIFNIFFEPRKVFENLKIKPKWLIPFIIISIIGITSFYYTYPFIMKQQIARIEESERIPDAQKEMIIERMSEMEHPPVWQLGFAPIGTLIYFLIIAGILFFVGNVLLGGDSSYGRVLSVFAYSSLIAIPAAIIKIPLVFMRETAEIQTSLALLLSPDMKESFIYRFLAQIDIFTIWTMILVSLGMAVMYNFTLRKSATTVFVLWLLWVLVSSALAGILGGFFRV